MALIYMADDDFDIISLASRWLRERRYEVRGFSNSEYLFKGIEQQIPDLILLDVIFGSEDGRDVCREIRNRYDDEIPIILFSGAYNSLKELGKTGANDFIKKSVSMEQLLRLLKEYIKIEEE